MARARSQESQKLRLNIAETYNTLEVNKYEI